MKNKYEWKKICACVLAICLSASLLMSHYIPGAFAEETTEEASTESTTEEASTESKVEGSTQTTETEQKSTTEEEKNTTETVSKGTVIEKKNQDDNKIRTQATNAEETIFYIDQGNITFSANSVKGYVKTENGYEQKSVEHTTQEYVIAQTDSNVMTTNYIQFEGTQTTPYNIILRNVNMGQNNTGSAKPGEGASTNSQGMILIPAEATKKVNLYIEGENVIKGIRYYVGTEYDDNWNEESYLNIDSANKSGSEDGKLYIPKKVEESEINDFVNSSQNYNHWNAGIGGTDAQAVIKGLTIKGATLQVLTTLGDNCSAIGGGGNGYSQINITGGNIRAICNGTGAAIGGGIGYSKYGGESDVNISGGTVYAENYGKIQNNNLTVGGVAIGGGSSFQANGSSAKVTVSGGTIRAYAAYGNGIGSGNSAMKTADNATIDINGGAVETNAIGGGSSETSTGGSATINVTGGKTVCKEYKDTNRFNTGNTINYIGSFGIGGGTSKEGNGGNSALSVKDGELDCGNGSIGGGTSKAEGNGGNATVNIIKGTLKAGKIGGGTAEGNNSDNNGGDASIYVTGGTLDCTSIGGGDSNIGTPGAVNSTTNKAGVVITGGTVKAGFIGGGKNNNNAVGFATANISGGKIQGQFILANTDTSKQCTFKMSGGTIDNTNLGTDNYKKAQEYGGAVYLSDPNGLVDISGGTIQNSKAPLGGAVYMTAGEFKLSGTGTIQDCSAIADTDGSNGYGGAVYLGQGTVTIAGGSIGTSGHKNKAVKGAGVYQKAGTMEMTDGTISSNEASEDGGGAYLAGGQLDVKGGTFASNKAANGAGSYVSNGTLNISGGTIKSNTADNGAGTYVSGGNLNINGGNLTLNTAKNGGGSYLAGGQLEISDGTITNNTADNGAGVYVSDSKVRMFGGEITLNKAANDGGGLYVSSDTKAADVVVRSGKLNHNSAGNNQNAGNGGAIAVVSKKKNAEDHVIIGLCETHKDLKTTDRTFTKFNYSDDKDDNKQHEHAACPEMEFNTSQGNGGGIYMDSSQAVLDVYCIYEQGNEAVKDSAGSSVMASGGKVNIGDDQNNNQNARGNIYIETPMLVKGGTVEISGNMDNPYFKGNILVDIAENAGQFTDNRISSGGDSASTKRDYKVHYYENFFGSGRYTAKQYTAKDTIKAEGTLYQHVGYKIVEWNTDSKKKGTSYPIGSMIASENDHSAWDDKGDTGAVILYAIWEKTSYTVKYEPNATQYTGKMEEQEFKYGESEALNANNYKVAGKRFTGWNTKADGTGTAYAADYSESIMSENDGETITLYAQWADCTHKGGTHPGTLSYTVDHTTHTITESCDCEGHTATVSISATSTYHDGNAHPATSTITGTIFGDVSDIVYAYKATESGDYADMPKGEIPTNTGYYKATISLDEKTTSVEYEIKSPASGIKIDASKAKGQRFEDIDDQKNLSIAKDDALTVQFDIQNLNKDTQVYMTAPTLKLSNELPSGTTVIMQTKDEYWYCKSPSGTEIQLNQFKKMGDSEKTFEYDTDHIASSQKYRFIIDFSKVSQDDQLNNDLTLTLEYQNKNTTSENVKGEAKVSFGNKGAFVVTSDNDTLKATAPANEAYTRWENKTMVWKISNNDSNEKLPSDAKLTVSTTNAGETQTSIYQQNQKGEFVIPFTWNSSKEFKLSLDSEQARLKGKSYTLKAELFVGNDTNNSLSLPQAAESNTAAGSATINVNIAQDTSPAVRITGTQRILTVSKGTDTTLDLTVKTENTDSCQLKATIQQKNNGAYTGEFLAADVITGENKFSTGGITTSGSYRLLIRVIKDNQIVMTVPYYFIVK